MSTMPLGSVFERISVDTGYSCESKANSLSSQPHAQQRIICRNEQRRAVFAERAVRRALPGKQRAEVFANWRNHRDATGHRGEQVPVLVDLHAVHRARE